MENGQPAIGITTAEKGIGGFFHLDYDGETKEFVRADVKRLQGLFNLGNAVLVETRKNHYHAIFFWDILPWGQIIRIIDFSDCDPEFKEFKRENKFCRLRINGNLKIVEIIKSPHHRENTMGDFYFNNYKMNLKFFNKF